MKSVVVTLLMLIGVSAGAEQAVVNVCKSYVIDCIAFHGFVSDQPVAVDQYSSAFWSEVIVFEKTYIPNEVHVIVARTDSRGHQEKEKVRWVFEDLENFNIASMETNEVIGYGMCRSRICFYNRLPNSEGETIEGTFRFITDYNNMNSTLELSAGRKNAQKERISNISGSYSAF